MLNDATVSALNIVGYIFIGIGVLVILGLVARFIAWISDLTGGFDFRRIDPLRLRYERTRMKLRTYKAACEMAREAMDCVQQEQGYAESGSEGRWIS